MDPPPTLIHLPSEIHDAILSFCKDGGSGYTQVLDSLTKVSKEARGIFAYYRFKDVKFTGPPSKFRYLRTALRKDVQIYANIQSASFEVTKGRLKQNKAPSESYLAKLPRHIFQSMQSMSNLKKLCLKMNHFPGAQIEAFCSVLADNAQTPQWGVSQLDVEADHRLASAVIQNCSPGSLEVLQLHSKLTRLAYDSLAERQPQLRKLFVNLERQPWAAGSANNHESEPRATELLRINTHLLREISDHFQYLESLVVWPESLDQGAGFLIGQNIPIQGQEEAIENAVRGFQNLQHLSCTIPKYLARDILSRRLQQEPTSQDYEEWYIALVHRIGSILPNIRDLHIFRNRYGEYIRGLRNRSEEPMVIEVCITYYHSTKYPFAFE